MWAWDDPAWPRWELTLGGETMARLERIAEEQAALDAEREASVEVQAQSLRDSIMMDSWASSEIEGERVSSRGLELAYDRPEEGRRTDPKASGVIAMQRIAREAPTIERETLGASARCWGSQGARRPRGREKASRGAEETSLRHPKRSGVTA